MIANSSSHFRFGRVLTATFSGRTETNEHKGRAVNEGKHCVVVQSIHVTIVNIKTSYRTGTTILYEAKGGEINEHEIH
jgi:hypothetical protein